MLTQSPPWFRWTPSPKTDKSNLFSLKKSENKLLVLWDVFYTEYKIIIKKNSFLKYKNKDEAKNDHPI